MCLLSKYRGLERFLTVETTAPHLTFTFPFFFCVPRPVTLGSSHPPWLPFLAARQLHQAEVKQDVISLM